MIDSTDPRDEDVSDLHDAEPWLLRWANEQKPIPWHPKAYLQLLASELESAKRWGTAHDMPEGARFITLSDTLAKQIAARLRTIAEAL